MCILRFKNIKDHLKVYPLADKANPKPLKYYDVSNQYLNTLHAQDITFFHEVNEIVQEEPAAAWDTESLGMLASIGIEKGKEFKPDARMTKILTEASSGLAQRMYAEQAQAAGAEGGADAGPAPEAESADPDAVDAEFEEVKDDK